MNYSITLINIASGSAGLLNEKTLHAIRNGGTLYLRTARSPIVSWLRQENIPFTSLDPLYDSTEDFEQLFSSIADALWTAVLSGPVVYAVSDIMTDRSVEAIFRLKPENGEVRIIPGIGLSDELLSEVKSVQRGSDLQIVTAADFLTSDYNPNRSLLITELDNDLLTGQVKLHLSAFLDDESEVRYLHIGNQPLSVPLYQLDRMEGIDHLSALFVGGSVFADRKRYVLADLLSIMETLRAPDGCPWDRAQTHQSLRPYMIEEAWECIAAIDQAAYDQLADELGDLLFQIVFHSSIGRSYDEFDMTDVINSICRKMIHRHPHVFSNTSGAPAAEPSLKEWERLKRSEQGRRTVAESLDDVSPALPSLKYAAKMLKKLSLIPAFQLSPGEIIAEIQKRAHSLNDHPSDMEPIVSQLLLLMSALCLASDYDGEILLHNAVQHLKNQIQAADRRAIADGRTIEALTFNELSTYAEENGEAYENR